MKINKVLKCVVVEVCSAEPSLPVSSDFIRARVVRAGLSSQYSEPRLYEVFKEENSDLPDRQTAGLAGAGEQTSWWVSRAISWLFVWLNSIPPDPSLWFTQGGSGRGGKTLSLHDMWSAYGQPDRADINNSVQCIVMRYQVSDNRPVEWRCRQSLST